jgi:hypothetical protein
MVLTTLIAAPRAHSSEATVESWVKVASTGLDTRALAALEQISGANRRLLALRAYLRAGDSLPQRWSWSQRQLADYEYTPEGRAAAADIDAVAAEFAAENPGFTLQVNRQPRSLEQQLSRWNENPGVGRVADSLERSLLRQFTSTATPNADLVRRALLDWSPSVAAPLAAPGLSAHGQGRAFDFQIEHDGTIVAGLEVAYARRDWDANGWTHKLQHAVSASGRSFSGPLQSPYEPWHYAYAPQSH